MANDYDGVEFVQFIFKNTRMYLYENEYKYTAWSI